MSMNLERLPKNLQAVVKAKIASSGKAAGKNKYGAVKTTVDNITFDSKAEAIRYQLNKIRISTGELQYQLLQVPIRLPGAVKYVVDFIEVQADGSLVYVDVKGKVTGQFRDKKRMVEDLYPFEIVCLKCSDYGRMVFEEVRV